MSAIGSSLSASGKGMRAAGTATSSPERLLYRRCTHRIIVEITRVPFLDSRFWAVQASGATIMAWFSIYKH